MASGRPGGRKASLRQSMSTLHTWMGLLPGWLLFVIFLFGTTAYFQQEISRWMRPEMSGPLSMRAPVAADRILRAQAMGAAEWNVSLPARSGQVVKVSWEGGGAQADGSATLDPSTGKEIKVRDTRGGNFLYRFHYELYGLPRTWARSLVCIAALAMLVAILSGVVTHKKIFTDFFLMRFGKGQRSWLDAHNVTAVLALPFHLMITYTGLAALLFTIMPWAISANFADSAAFNEVAYPEAPIYPVQGRPAATLPIALLMQRAQAEWNASGATNALVGGLTIVNPGDAGAVANIYAQRDRLARPAPRLFIQAATGTVLQRDPPGGAARATQDIMILLHLGTFADIALRWLYFLSGALGTAMIGTGLVLWTTKRRARLPDPSRPHLGFRLVEKLNIAVMVGSSGGIAGYFLANRLLPTTLSARSDREIELFFLSWGALAVWAAVRPARRAWIEALFAAALLYALIPPINALTTRRGLLHSLAQGDWVFLIFDLVMLSMALLFAFVGWRLGRRDVAVLRPSQLMSRVPA